ncbi:MAG TPA: hypothetical protein VIG24_14935 [Acidimicrobiia bacterium]
MIHNPAIVDDPVTVTKRLAHTEGQREMRDLIASMLAGWAAEHPSKIIQDELFQFVDDVRRVMPR